MPMENSRDRDTGMWSHSLSLVTEALRYLKARAVLAGEEAKAAGAKYGVAAAMVAGALFIVTLGYIFLVVTVVFAIGLAFDSPHAWLGVLVGATLLHFIGAAVLIILAKKRVGKSAFPETLAEIEKDRLWLRQLTAKN